MPPDVTRNENAWDQGELGQDEKFVRRSPAEREESVDEALSLQLVSIRLPKELIEKLKFIANYHGKGYQPIVRDVVCRWAEKEMFAIAEQMQRELSERPATKKRA
jgi:predicted DNA-binding protein